METDQELHRSRTQEAQGCQLGEASLDQTGLVINDER